MEKLLLVFLFNYISKRTWLKSHLYSFLWWPLAVSLACIPLAVNVIFNILSSVIWAYAYLHEVLKPRAELSSLLPPCYLMWCLHLTDISKLLSIAVKNHQVKGWDAGLMKCAGTVLEASAQKGLFWRRNVITERLRLSRVLRRNPGGNQRANWNVFLPS